jgi:hypothetical protein
MRATSLRDILLADSLSHITNEVLLIHPSNDKLVAEVLEQIGYDITQPWEYVPSKHRSMDQKIAIGYMVVGEFSRKREHRHFLDANDLIVLAGMSDASLGRELSEMSGRRNTYKNNDETENTRHKPGDVRYYSDEELLELGYTMGSDEDDVDPYERDYIESDWEENLRAIKVLEDIRDAVRGKQ